MLTKTGQWYWRDGEISFRDFQYLPKDKKQEHLLMLEKMDLNDLSSNDKIILSVYSKKSLEEPVEHFIKL